MPCPVGGCRPNLRELAVDIQGRAVEFIKLVPGRYSAAAGNEAGFVESIEVEASDERNYNRSAGQL